MNAKKRYLIVTGAGLGAALLALFIALATGGPTAGSTALSTLLYTAWFSTFVLATAVALITHGDVGGPTVVITLITIIPATFVLTVWGDYAVIAVCGVVGALVANSLATRTARRWREARLIAEERIAWRKENEKADRERLVNAATASIPAPWLIDAHNAAESTARGTLLAALDPDTAWALARLHRKGVPAEYVAAHWVTGAPLDADTLVTAYRNVVAS